MTRCTSISSHRETRESGQESTQAEKILEIISLGGNLSLQEIMGIYRYKWSNIELSSVSARVNKLKAEGLVFEAGTRKCSISDKIINSLSAAKEKGLGEYQAWVEAGKTKDEQLARYEKAPKHMQKNIASHMKTVQALRLVK